MVFIVKVKLELIPTNEIDNKLKTVIFVSRHFGNDVTHKLIDSDRPPRS